MPLTTVEIHSLTQAGFRRKRYHNQEDLEFFVKLVPCKNLGFLSRSAEYTEMYVPDDLTEVEVVGDRRLVQLVVQNSEYVATGIELDDELGRLILADCGVGPDTALGITQQND